MFFTERQPDFIKGGLFFIVIKATECLMQRPMQTLLSVVSTSIIADTPFSNIWKRIQVHSMKPGKEVTRTNPYVKLAGSSVGNSRC